MTKRFLICILALVMSTHLYGCSSSDSKEDGATAESNDESFSEEGEGDFAEEDGGGDSGGDELETGDDTKVADEAPPSDDGGSLDEGGDDLSLDEEGGGDKTAKADEKPADQASTGGEDELSLDEPEALPEGVASTQDPGVAPPAEPAPPVETAQVDPAPPPTDEPLFKDEAPKEPEVAASSMNEPPPVSEPGLGGGGEAPVASYLPLLKVKEAPFTKNGANLNRVYVARPGDTAKSVSTKIYGSNRSKDLKAWNPILQSRPMKTGDKIYYQSAKAPEDQRMITYYEDIGATPQTYVTKEGDNIRSVSKNLLGNKDSWKEVWATNPAVESKGDVPAGVELRYWADGADAGLVAQGPGAETVAPPADTQPPPTDVATNEQPPTPPPMDAPPGDMNGGNPGSTLSSNGGDPFPPPDANSNPPPPVDVAQNPPPDMNAPGTIGAPPTDMAPPPPPPPPVDAQPPPPPPPPEVKPVAKKPNVPDMGATDPDTMMAMGFGGILLIAAALLFIVIRKNRAKRVDLGQTQV